MTMHLHNQVALITGAASGLGKSIAKTFATAGARVVIADLHQQAAEATADEIVADGGRAIGVALDVTQEAQVEAVVEYVAKAFGSIDILVSNAGVQIVKPLQEFSFNEWRTIMAVHLDGAFLLTRACLPYMYARKRGCILYMGSVHSKEASLLKAPYVTAKHGILGLCRTVAKEGAMHGVRANVICPGFVRTPLVDKQIPEQAKALGITEAQVVRDVMLRGTVDGEFTTERDIAEVALMFAGFESAALTGQSLIVSHGWVME
jgi:3-hydroxybutyrate dehydrogenase